MTAPAQLPFEQAHPLQAALARIELQAVFSQLIPRFPAMRLAVPAGEVTFHCDTLAGGLAQLPVTW